MADPSLEEEVLLREWAPLTDLLQQIPLKAQRGLFTHDLSLTCVDTLPEFIAVGTNLGLIYWYNRKKGDLQRLRCENTASSITCVKVISTVDFMVAAGNDQGIVTVFQIPKVPPDNLPESMKPKKNKQVERYTISGLHSSPVTAIEWSMNGMKLFSGDKNGLVVLTEIDFYMHLSKSVELLNEKYEVVQLSYSQQLLLVSTLYRCIVCYKEDRWKVVQVGQKERKSLGKLGATFSLGSGRPQELVVYSSRPGLRIWLADKHGVVQQTLIYKDALINEHTHTPLINPAPSHMRQARGDHQFGPVVVFRENLLVTYSSDMVYVLNPATITVVATIADLRSVRDVAVNKDEIFILEGERSLVRVSYSPEITTSFVQVNHTPTVSTSETLIRIVGTTEVQEMLADKATPKKTVWDHVAEEMKNIGIDMGENGGERCRQKWSNIVRNYHYFSRTKNFNHRIKKPAYYDILKAILVQNEQRCGSSGEMFNSKDSVKNSDCGSVSLKRKQNEDVLYDQDNHHPTLPKQNCQIFDSDSISSSDIPFSSSDISEEEDCVDYTVTANSSTQNTSDANHCNDEELILVYPGGTKYSVNSKSLEDSAIFDELESRKFVICSYDSDNLSTCSFPNYIDHSYTEEIFPGDKKQISKISFPNETGSLTDIHPSSTSVFDNTMKPISVSRKGGKSSENLSTIIVSPKPNQPARPVPTAAEAMMSLVMRLHEEDKRKEKARIKRSEERIQNIEKLLQAQSVNQRELLNKALLTLKELR